MHSRLIRLPLVTLALAALACATFGGAGQTPTPATQPTAIAPAAATASAVGPTSATLAPQLTTTASAAATTVPATAGVNLSNSGQAETPRLAYDAQGTLHLVWYDKSTRQAGDVFHRQKAANGDWTIAEKLSADFEFLYGDISLIRDQDGHICVIFAAAKDNNGPATIGLYQRCQAGTTWSPAARLAITQQTGVTLRGYSPARGTDGTVHAAYIISGGTIYFDDVQLSKNDVTALAPSLAIDKAGGYHVTWVNLGTATSPSTVQYRFSADQGKTWQDAQTLSTDQNTPDGGTVTLVSDGVGNVHLLWSGGDVTYRRWTPAGGWGPAAALAGDQNGADPNLAMDGQGLAHAVWPSHNNIGLYGAVQATDGKWSAPRMVSGLESGEPRIAIDAQGGSHIAWLTNKDLFYLAVP